MQDFSEAIRLNPKKSSYYLNRGLVYFSIENNNKAIDDFTKAIELDPEFANAYQSRAETLKRIGNYVEAL